MKNFLVFVAFVALGTFAVIEFKKVNSLRHELDSLQERPAAVEAPRIICPLCHGEKFITYEREPGNRTFNERVVCPLCRGVGGRILTVPPGEQICPDCQGMGLVYFQAEPGFYQVTACARCAGTGLIASF